VTQVPLSDAEAPYANSCTMKQLYSIRYTFGREIQCSSGNGQPATFRFVSMM